MNESSIFSLFYYFKLFRKKAGRKFYLLAFCIMLNSLIGAFGISLMLPILNISTTKTLQDPYSKTISDFFHFVGIEVSLLSLLAFVVIVFFLKSILQFSQDALRVYIVNWLLEIYQKKIAKLYSNMKYLYYINTKIGFFNNIITTEANNAVNSLQMYILVFIALMNSIIYFFFSLYINYAVTLLSLAVGGILFIAYGKIRKKVTDLSLQIPGSNAAIQDLMIQYIQYFKYFKCVSGKFDFLMKLFKEIKHNRMLRTKHAIYKTSTNSSLEPVNVLFLSVIIYFLVEIKNQDLLLIIVPLFLLNRFLNQILLFHRSWQDFCGSLGAVSVFEKAQAMLSENRENTQGQYVPGLQEGIVLRRLKFSFNTKNVLNGIDMEIPWRKCIGITGESGSGKTTLLDIITGLLSPDSGEITYDGIPYSKLDKKELRSMFGYMTQEPIIFNDTIANNISLWSCDSTKTSNRKNIEDAAKAAYCWNFIEGSKDGIYNFVGDKGVKLSGGQRQRICIAREIFRNCDVLIFDEATSSLDSESEMSVQRSIEELLGTKSIIIVAHRLSTLRMCDMIYILRKGEIVERGNWADLVNSSRNSLLPHMSNEQGVLS